MQSRRSLSSRKRPSFPNELSKTGDYKRFRTLRTGAAVELSGERRHQEPACRAAHARRFYSELLSYSLEEGNAVAAVYPEAFDAEVHPYLDVTRLFLEAEIPVPDIYAVDGETGIIVQEDLGDRQLFRVYESAPEDECDEYKERAVNLIAQIQKATDKAYERKSIASRLAFDEAKLSWELDFFVEHYFGSLKNETLRHAEAAELKSELNDIAAELSARPVFSVTVTSTRQT